MAIRETVYPPLPHVERPIADPPRAQPGRRQRRAPDDYALIENRLRHYVDERFALPGALAEEQGAGREEGDVGIDGEVMRELDRQDRQRQKQRRAVGRAQAEDPPREPLPLIFARDVLNHCESPPQIVEDLICKGETGIIWSDPEGGKTTLALYMGTGVATGTTFNSPERTAYIRRNSRPLSGRIVSAE